MKKYTINIVILRKADGTYLAYSPDLNEAKPIPQALVISAMELANTDPDRAPPGMFAVFKDEIMKGMITTIVDVFNAKNKAISYLRLIGEDPDRAYVCMSKIVLQCR